MGVYRVRLLELAYIKESVVNGFEVKKGKPIKLGFQIKTPFFSNPINHQNTSVK